MACRLVGAKPLSEPNNAGILLIEPLRTNFVEISIEIHTFSFKEMHLKMSSGKWRPFCLGLNVLNSQQALHTSPSPVSYGVSIERILEKINHVIKAPHVITWANVDLPWMRSLGIQCRILSIWILKISTPNLCLKFKHKKSQQHPSRDNELVWCNVYS